MKKNMRTSSFALLALLLPYLSSCQKETLDTDLFSPPPVLESDRAFANVFTLLDGKWRGQFKIFEDQNRQPKRKDALKNLRLEKFDNPKLKLVGTIEVEQEYQSESPFFQRVKITDFYPETGKKVISQGVNKVQDGKMWCVVQKPDETVIHKGTTHNKRTIIWQRKEQNPQKVEYFQEMVTGNRYEIIGWGYYEGDDLSLMPKFWFYGNYEKIGNRSR